MYCMIAPHARVVLRLKSMPSTFINILFWLSIVVLSQAPILIRFANASSLAICFWRLIMASALIFPFALWKMKLRFRSSNTVKLKFNDYFQLAFSGSFLFAHLYFFFRAVQETSIANATILYSISPVTTALGAWLFFQERVTLHLAISCFLGLFGISVLFGESIFSLQQSGNFWTSLWGNLWAVLSAVCFSGYILTGKHVRVKLANSIYAFSVYAQTAFFAFIAMTLLKVPMFGYSNQTWLAFLTLAILPTIFGHALFTYCLNHLNVNFMSCMTLTEPLLSAAAAAWLFGERLSSWSALGFAFTAASVLVLYWEPLINYFRFFRLPWKNKPKVKI